MVRLNISKHYYQGICYNVFVCCCLSSFPSQPGPDLDSRYKTLTPRFFFHQQGYVPSRSCNKIKTQNLASTYHRLIVVGPVDPVALVVTLHAVEGNLEVPQPRLRGHHHRLQSSLGCGLWDLKFKNIKEGLHKIT